jgi:Ca2+-binding RTX toxin-like protein
MSVEHLEGRRVFAAMFDASQPTGVHEGHSNSFQSSIVWDASSGILTLDGTLGDDTASVSQVNNSARTFEANLNGTTRTIALGRMESISEIVFEGHAGDDTFVNNTDFDSDANGGQGNDTLTGGTGTDNLEGGGGDDTLVGGGGVDYLHGGEGTDSLSGGDGDDYMYGDDGQDVMDGGEGDDRMYGGDDADSMTGGRGDDRVFGQSGADTLEGEDGDDYIVGADGDDVINGGDGDDTIDGGDEEDTISGGAGSDDIDGGAGGDVIEGGSDADNIKGGDGQDQIHGNGGDDYIEGGNGDDHLYGDGGMDELRGNAGNDGLFGGRSNDTLYGGSGGDRFLTQSGDTVNAVNDNDAEIKFASTSGEKTRYDGSRITWQSGAWTEAEIEVLDVALASLHQRTGNTNLLKTSKGKTITFYRVGSSSNTAIGGWNDGSDVYITENRMDSDGNGSTADSNDAPEIYRVVFHEIAHFWDKEHDGWSAWKDISGWKWRVFSGLTHDGTSGFAREYGEKNPKEDFATVFAKVMQENLGEIYDFDSTGTAAGLQDKEDHINDFLDSV